STQYKYLPAQPQGRRNPFFVSSYEVRGHASLRVLRSTQRPKVPTDQEPSRDYAYDSFRPQGSGARKGANPSVRVDCAIISSGKHAVSNCLRSFRRKFAPGGLAGRGLD